MGKWVAIIILAVAILLATAAWYGEQKYKDCLYVAVGGTQANNTGNTSRAPLATEPVGTIHCSRSPF